MTKSKTTGKLVRLLNGAFFLACLLGLHEASAAPGVQLAYAVDGHNEIRKTEVDLVWPTRYQWEGEGNWRLNLDVEIALARWHNTTASPERRSLNEFGFSPVFRLEHRGRSMVPFIEASIGLRMLSHAGTSADHRMGSAFQFADMLGLSVKFGGKEQFVAGLRVQHLSNGGLKKPNPGVNFGYAYLGYAF